MCKFFLSRVAFVEPDYFQAPFLLRVRVQQGEACVTRYVFFGYELSMLLVHREGVSNLCVFVCALIWTHSPASFAKRETDDRTVWKKDQSLSCSDLSIISKLYCQLTSYLESFFLYIFNFIWMSQQGFGKLLVFFCCTVATFFAAASCCVAPALNVVEQRGVLSGFLRSQLRFIHTGKEIPLKVDC